MNTKPPTKPQEGIEDSSRNQIATFLPSAMSKALSSYHLFMEQDVPDDAKGFSAHHGAAKVAIAHIELLIKLAKWADLPGATVDADKALANLVHDAEQTLREYHATQETDEDEHPDFINGPL